MGMPDRPRPMRSHGMDPWGPLALQALCAAYRRDARTMSAALARMQAEHGAEAPLFALASWVSTVLKAYGIVPGGAARTVLRFAAGADGIVRVPAGQAPDLATYGELMLAEDVAEPALVWAGRLVAARAAGDRETFEALLEALIGLDSTREQMIYVMTLASACAGLLRQAGWDGTVPC